MLRLFGRQFTQNLGAVDGPLIYLLVAILCGWHDDSLPGTQTGLFVLPAVDACYLFHPTDTVAMLESKNVIQRPVEVIGQIGYLLVQAV